jgi:hypothetical protein
MDEAAGMQLVRQHRRFALGLDRDRQVSGIA